MGIDFDNIFDHVIPIEDFPWKGRFIEYNNNKFPPLSLNLLKPFDQQASKFLWDFIVATELHSDIPFKKDFFRTIDKAIIFEGNEREVKKWLYQRRIPFEKMVFLSYQPEIAMVVPWKLLIKYFDDFYNGDDLTVIDASLNWALLFFHEDEIYFGSNESFVPSKTYDDINFLW